MNVTASPFWMESIEGWKVNKINEKVNFRGYFDAGSPRILLCRFVIFIDALDPQCHLE